MIKCLPVTRAIPGMWFHRIAGGGVHPVFVRHSFLLTAREIDALRRGGVAEILIDTEQGLDLIGWPEYVEVEAVEPQVESDEVDPEPAESADEVRQTEAIEEAEAEASGEAEPEPEVAEPAPADAEVPAAVAPPRAKPSPRSQRSIDAELVSAQKLCLSGKAKMIELFNEARMGHAVRPEAVEPLVAEISASVTRHPDALISVARLKRHDDYTYLHSVAVCALMIALARRLDLSDDEVREAGVGGMLHDIGKAMMPLNVLNKPGALTDDEFRIMKSHPQAGFELLREGGGASAAALEIALHHHEKFDGSGYPHGQSGEGISRLSRMGAVCDVYDAISSNRPYKRAWSPAESVRRMAAWNGHFDTRILNSFIRSVGIYPVGALVKLQSEHLAVVLEQHDETLLTPKVRIFYSARKREPVFLRDLDLAAANCADRIVGIESPEAWGFSALEKLWMPG
jgi:putative nucleotidyltransferase with HDIG domain